jgi:SP family facilitated glucose transporter-like MFS transporter 1
LTIEKENLSKQKKVSWLELIQVRSLRRPLLVAIGIMVAQQFSGINAVIFYSTKIFESVGLEGIIFLINDILMFILN